MTEITGQARRRTEPLRADGRLEDRPNGDRAPAPRIVCMNCSEPTRLTTVRKSAEEFCLACDHPLFWIPAFLRTPDEDPASDIGDDSLRRRPGTAGRRRLVGRPCPTCAEPNDVRAVYCLRCGSHMDPPAPPVTAAVPTTTPAFVAEPTDARMPFWLMAAIAMVCLVALIALAALLF